tara:strand:+ start:3714 stop:3956 length:243 start_codon:yes stop_codon:yes gene_type:complete
MVKFKIERGWDYISSSDKDKIKTSLIDIKNPKSDRYAILDFLFEMYNLHMRGNYSRGAQTCPSCVQTVIKTFNNKINNGK